MPDDQPQRPVIKVEPQTRRFRVLFGGETLADSVNCQLLMEGKYFPVVYFPLADVRQDLMRPTDHGSHCPWKGDASYWTLVAGGKTAENAAWAYRDPLPEMEAIKDHVSFYWNKVDGWLEEDRPLLGHARNPYSRIDTFPASRRVVVKAGGETLADSSRAVFLFETGMPARYYIPAADVRMDLMEATDTSSVCPYKGRAGYYAAKLPGGTVKDIAWFYPDPFPEVALIKDHLCFYPERVDSIVVAPK